MSGLTKRQREVVADNLRAFIHNFGEPKIVADDYGHGFYVYYPADSESDAWIQYCYDLSYLDGWLYGVVQGRVRGEFKRKRRDC